MSAKRNSIETVHYNNIIINYYNVMVFSQQIILLELSSKSHLELLQMLQPISNL